MQFFCIECGAKYALPDERAAGKILKIRCRRCSHINTVDGSALVVPGQPATPPAVEPVATSVAIPVAPAPMAAPPAVSPEHGFDAPAVVSLTTRMVIEEAGLANLAARQRVIAAVAIALVAVLAAALVLDAVDAVRIPFLHTAVVATQRVVAAHPKPEVSSRHGWQSMLSEDERAALRRALLEGNAVEVRRVQEQARRRAKEIGVDIDLSDQVATSAPAGDEVRRRESTASGGVELSTEQQTQLRQLLALEQKQQATIQVKPTIPEIRMPTRTEGGLTDEQVGKVVAENQGGIQFCANQETKRGIKLPPQLNLALTMGNDGKVSGARVVETDQRTTDLGRCLVTKARVWRFPEFTGEPLEIEIPLKFTTIN